MYTNDILKIYWNCSLVEMHGWSTSGYTFYVMKHFQANMLTVRSFWPPLSSTSSSSTTPSSWGFSDCFLPGPFLVIDSGRAMLSFLKHMDSIMNAAETTKSQRQKLMNIMSHVTRVQSITKINVFYTFCGHHRPHRWKDPSDHVPSNWSRDRIYRYKSLKP